MFYLIKVMVLLNTCVFVRMFERTGSISLSCLSILLQQSNGFWVDGQLADVIELVKRYHS